MKTLKVVGLIALIFIAGFTGGVVATLVVVRWMVDINNKNNPQQVRANAELGVDVRLNRWLRLDPEQRTEVKQILKDSREKMRDVRDEVQPRLNIISLEARSNIYAVLKPPQQDRFAQFLDDNRQFLAVREMPPGRRLEKPPPSSDVEH